jgi:signal transduction histidine kinase
MAKPTPKQNISLKRSGARSKRRQATTLKQAGKLLHDEVAPLLSAAGLKLHLLCMDFPDATQMADEATAILERAMDRVRELSRELCPPPDYSRSLGGSPLSRTLRAARGRRK